jgi:hypothetical protein
MSRAIAPGMPVWFEKIGPRTWKIHSVKEEPEPVPLPRCSCCGSRDWGTDTTTENMAKESKDG